MASAATQMRKVSSGSAPQLPNRARVVVGVAIACGFSVLVYALFNLQVTNAARFWTFLAFTAVASRLKLQLPGVNGTMSVNLPFLIIGLLELNFAEILLIASVAAALQSVPRKRDALSITRALFNVSIMAVGVGVAELTARSLTADSWPFALLSAVAAVAAFLISQTLPVAGVISLVEHKSFRALWVEILRWSAPYYAVSAILAALATTLDVRTTWYIPLALLPMMFAAYQVFRVYFRRTTAQIPA